ncbi:MULTISPECIES: hypothetical protein [Pseudomonas]|uniref:Uncharacterized protein n=1 Tax=Pseudomonas fluorescens TaxID=294 RepID=A0A166QMP1_PSEFL|nr:MULTISPECIES: hypothetical protein [Pseudomonas]KZN20541.1 hypothetical protein A1D17_03090 [Pseudomonas fluorescens]
MSRYNEYLYLADKERQGCIDSSETERLAILRKQSKEQFAFFITFLATFVAAMLATGFTVKSLGIGLVAGVTALLIKRSKMG